MTRDGKQLEALVKFVEQTLTPEGFSVTTNDRVFNEDGVQIAEFDVLVQGRVGTADFTWLIECRDRPSSGAAPSAWIEQLVGRRTRFNFNKVTAVSTTGFAVGAHEFAQAQGIELREVAALEPEHFADWLRVRHITNVVRQTILKHALFALKPGASQEIQEALLCAMEGLGGNTPILRATSNGQMVTPAQAFSAVASANTDLFDGLEPNGPAKTVQIVARYPDHDHFTIETALGWVDIKEIRFSGDLRLQEFKLPVVYSGEYRDAKTGAAISQVVTYAPLSFMGNEFSIEIHKLTETGETHVIMRRGGSDA